MNTDGLNTYRPRVLPMSALLNTEEYVVKPATSPHIEQKPESCDSPILHIPEKFESWEKVFEFADRARIELGHPIMKRSSVSIAVYNKTVSSRNQLPVHVKYRKVIFGCKHGNKRKSQSTGRRKTSTHFKGCPFKFIAIAKLVSCDQDPSKYQVSIQIKSNQHNHSVPFSDLYEDF